ncbi:von Willebrand factor type A domain-containing protein [Podospora didyma]|uniref:von Willebrand factor type A domain-containing protein n=1 Tax=Podospora didyma TaxID=330526 RepID=A0AAE0P626_9PEZI|nr:von Willebrand factor type A domain-containing protein [Podospora didyma]
MAYNRTHTHICGFYFFDLQHHTRRYLPQVAVSVHAQIIASTSRTTLTQTFVNPPENASAIPELRYTFPLYDGVSVVGFVCTINGNRVIRGLVKEKEQARQTYNAAVARGETAGLLEQLPDASDVFTTTVGNIPAGATIKVDITYLGELKQDAEVDGIRFTIPTSIAPRYGEYPGELISSAVSSKAGINIVVDAEMPDGSQIKNVQSPSHPISVTVGNTSTGAAKNADMSLQKASATLALGSAELDKDFVVQIVATNTGNPIAVLENHPTIPNQRALMATLVPKFNIPASRPEIVFLCDRSGSMGDGIKIPNLKAALHVFLKSLPIGVKFNICSFGSNHEFLFKKGSQSYDASTLEKATRYVDTFNANFGGTEISRPLEQTFKQRYGDMELEVFLLTDGEIWDQENLFGMMNRYIQESKGAIRVFPLGLGSGVSHSLIEGCARAGNGFAQIVGDNEKMNNKVVRMLKASLTPHVKDYTLEVKYEAESTQGSDDDFEIVEKVMDALVLEVPESEPEGEGSKPAVASKPISLFDASADPDADVEMADASLDKSAGGKYSHVPPVPEPKLLQAPFNIPPLFSFNRTTVYLLLSPETTQKTPKSVILRGTCAHGPLEIEIPVTVLPEKGETIHQLAARKAVGELEEGRGWIYHAKDAKGRLLVEKHQGRFSDMVEREAVRLGVTFQVGGKWCSFVAVENNKEQNETAQSQAENFQQGAMSGIQHSALASVPKASSVKAKSSAPKLAIAHPQKRSFQTRGAVQMSAMSAMLGGPPPGIQQQQLQQQMQYAAIPPPPMDGMSFGSPLPTGGVRRNRAAPPPPAPQAFMAMAAPRALAASRPATKSISPSSTTVFKKSRKASVPDDPLLEGVRDTSIPADPLEALIALQTFTGSWAWTRSLLDVLKLQGSQAEISQKAVSLNLDPVGSLFATALVLAFLETKLAGKKDEWEMLVEKARDWMSAELASAGGPSAEECIEKVKVLV